MSDHKLPTFGADGYRYLINGRRVRLIRSAENADGSMTIEGIDEEAEDRIYAVGDAPSPGWKLLKDTTQDERSYPEDANHENGNYSNCCVHCLRMFVGHKRRGICKVCASGEGEPSDAQRKWDVWMEGFLATGMEGRPAPARLLGAAEAETFAEACATICASREWQEANGNFDPVSLSVWGCRLFSNEAQARAAFG